MAQTQLQPDSVNAGEQLLKAISNLKSGDFTTAVRLLADPLWVQLETLYWSASHPLPKPALDALNGYLVAATTLWLKTGLGRINPISHSSATLKSSLAIEVALRVLARIYAGCNLGYRAPPAGFWRTVYAITGFLVSGRIDDRALQDQLSNQVKQLWLMSWLNPLSLAPGRLPVAVKLVGILSKNCSYTMTPPTHAGSGLAAADLLSDIAPMPFARVPPIWEPIAPLYVNAQDAAFAIQRLSVPPSRSEPSDAYDSLLKSALQVGLTVQEMQDFIKRVTREFGFGNGRSITRVGRADRVSAVIGYIEIWSVLQKQNKSAISPTATIDRYEATVINHSNGGFLIKFKLERALLSVGSIIAMRGTESEPWTIAAIRWLEEADSEVLAGCEVFCNYAEARIGQSTDGKQHWPLISYMKDEQLQLISPYGQPEASSVAQVMVNNRSWVVSVATEMGQDWQSCSVLDTQ